MRTKTDGASSRSGWLVAIAAVTVAGVLFLRIPSPIFRTDRPVRFDLAYLNAVLALGCAVLGLWFFRTRIAPERSEDYRKVRNALFLVVLQAALLRTTVELGPLIQGTWCEWWPAAPWVWTPWFLTTGLAAMLLGSRLGVWIGLSGVFLLYLRADPGPLPLVGCLVSSLYGILLLRRPTRQRALRAGLGAGALLGLVALIEGLQAGVPLHILGFAVALPVGVGLISAFAVLAALPVLEWMLGELSDVTLIEYASGHPLLDQLQERAPGTWHHSLNVADLAEKAASGIGARALFCRTAALYHDIGKMKNPSFFAENIHGPSPHDELEPRESARRILSHVTDGLELAREYHLPRPFREIIAEHHGISVVRYFYRKACEQLGPGEDLESVRAHFTYPGPPPSSRESGIIALADAVEAATRSFEAKSYLHSRTYVRQLIAERVAEGELAKCPLTLAELAQIEETFVRWVVARDHRRPAYAGNPASASTSTDWSGKPSGATQWA